MPVGLRAFAPLMPKYNETDPFLQNMGSVAHGQLTIAGYGSSYSFDSYLVWRKGPSWYFRTLHGCWCDVRQDGRYSCQGDVQVRRSRFRADSSCRTPTLICV